MRHLVLILLAFTSCNMVNYLDEYNATNYSEKVKVNENRTYGGQVWFRNYMIPNSTMTPSIWSLTSIKSNDDRIKLNINIEINWNKHSTPNSYDGSYIAPRYVMGKINGESVNVSHNYQVNSPHGNMIEKIGMTLTNDLEKNQSFNVVLNDRNMNYVLKFTIPAYMTNIHRTNQLTN